jgi:hypothetical protein
MSALAFEVAHLPFSFYDQSFWFGSVPLRTYLPDGDIDVCAFPEAGTAFEWFSRFQTLLEAQANDPNADFSVKNITVVNADVLFFCVLFVRFHSISLSSAGSVAGQNSESSDRLRFRRHFRQQGRRHRRVVLFGGSGPNDWQVSFIQALCVADQGLVVRPFYCCYRVSVHWFYFWCVSACTKVEF